MRNVKTIFSFLLSIVVIAVSVVILITVSLISMVFNSILFILMISGLGVPVLGNMLVNKISGNK